MSRGTYLLDASVLIALSTPDHVFEQVAREWAKANLKSFATSPGTQGSLLRAAMRTMDKPDFRGALETLHSITSLQGHIFLPDDLPYSSVEPSKVIGHRQVTDAYLVALAEKHGCTLVTLDRHLAALYPANTLCLI